MEKVRLQSKICTFWNMLTVLFFVFYLNWLTDYFYFTFQSIRLLSLIVNYLSFSLFLSLLLGCCLLVSSFLNLHGPWIQVEHIFSYINDTWGSFCILCFFGLDLLTFPHFLWCDFELNMGYCLLLVVFLRFLLHSYSWISHCTLVLLCSVALLYSWFYDDLKAFGSS